MAKFLLDANLSPKIGRYLSEQFGLDVTSLLTLGRGEISDHEVLRLARSSGRVIITLDEDFARPQTAAGRVGQGIIYLALPNSRRYVPEIQHVLATFFQHHAAAIDLERSLVILSEDRIEFHRS